MKKKKRVKHYFIDDRYNNYEPLKTVCGFNGHIFVGVTDGNYKPIDITCKRCLKTKRYKTDAFNHLLGVTNE